MKVSKKNLVIASTYSKPTTVVSHDVFSVALYGTPEVLISGVPGCIPGFSSTPSLSHLYPDQHREDAESCAGFKHPAI